MRAILRLATLFLSVAGTASAQWHTSQGGTAARDGRVIAQGPLSAQAGWTSSKTNQKALTPIVADGLVIAGRTSNFMDPDATDLVAYELATGAVRWQVTLPKNALNAGFMVHPVAWTDGKVIATRAGSFSFDEYLYALDPADGSILWQSADLVNFAWAASPALAPNGDLFVNGPGQTFMRIDAATGQTVWQVPFGTFEEIANGVWIKGRLYAKHAVGQGEIVRRFDPDTGALLYQSAQINAQSTGHLNLFGGPDGTIYWPLQGSGLYALEDTGTGFNVRWSSPMRSTVWSTFAVGPQGHVYSYSPNSEIVKLNPVTGTVVATGHTGLQLATVRSCIDAGGNLYVAGSGSGAGPHVLFAFDPDLNLLWQETLAPSPMGAVVLADNGTLITVGTDKHVRTWLNPGGGCGAQTYCSTSPNSVGAGALIDKLGSLSLADDNLTLLVSDLPAGQFGLFFQGQGQVQLPLGDGFLCVAPPLVRLPVVSIKPDGGARWTMDLASPPTGGEILAGSTWSFQFWYRDPAAGGSGSNLSDGLELTFCP
jgi:outer membrane protein assembly factor BamB